MVIEKVEFKNKIIELLQKHQGMKLLELIPAMFLAFQCNPRAVRSDIEGIVDEMISAGEIKAYQYSIPELGNRLKTFLIPGDYDVVKPEERKEEVFIDVWNQFNVGVQGNDILMLNPTTRMEPEKALIMAAWLVAAAEDKSTVKFSAILNKVRNT